MAQEQDKLLNSNYDDIQEYDNDLPKWWLWLFYITVIFAVVYVIYYHGGFTQQTHEYLASQMAEIEQHKQAAETKMAANEPGEPEMLAIAKDSSLLAKGKEIFIGKCAACHGQLGEGLVGPNLTDNNWIHGGKILDIKKVVREGVLEKGMVPWAGVISPEEINAAVAYVWSLHGTNPPNAKAPEGAVVLR